MAVGLDIDIVEIFEVPKVHWSFFGALDHFLLTVKSDKQVDPWLLMCVCVFLKGVLYYLILYYVNPVVWGIILGK